MGSIDIALDATGKTRGRWIYNVEAVKLLQTRELGRAGYCKVEFGKGMHETWITEFDKPRELENIFLNQLEFINSLI